MCLRHTPSSITRTRLATCNQPSPQAQGSRGTQRPTPWRGRSCGCLSSGVGAGVGTSCTALIARVWYTAGPARWKGCWWGRRDRRGEACGVCWMKHTAIWRAREARNKADESYRLAPSQAGACTLPVQHKPRRLPQQGRAGRQTTQAQALFSRWACPHHPHALCKSGCGAL